MRTSAVLLAVAAMLAPSAAAGPARATGTLELRGTVPFVSRPAVCPADVPSAEVVCHARTGSALVAGLGRVTESYVFLADPRPCPPEQWTVLSYPARLSVQGKGDLNLLVSAIGGCIAGPGVPAASPQSFTVTSGTGVYAGATGSGTLTRFAGFPGPRVLGQDTWTGTLVVPGVEFDTTAPTITGATSRTVRARRKARRVRVAYNVTATDAVDGATAVTCRPRSGTLFPVGRSIVRCSSADSSGNEATASFTVTVRRR